MDAASEITVEHVRLRGAQVAASPARQRLSYLLSSVRLCPSRMSPSAVLVVRSMRDPLPGAIAPQFDSAVLPNPAWERAAQARLDALCAEASRPARSAVRPSAEAVLFADYGELLACLALDLGTGAAPAWWWQSLLRHHPVRGFKSQSELWPRVWAEHPMHVPAALQQLDERNQAVCVLARIAPSKAWQLLVQVVRAFGLPSALLAGAADEEAGPMEAGGGESRPSPGGRANAPAQPRSRGGWVTAASGRAAIVPPWEPCVSTGAVPPALGVERRALLGISLLLHRDARQTAMPHFAPRLRSWIAAERARAAEIAADGTASAPPRPSAAVFVTDAAGTRPSAALRARASPQLGLHAESPSESATIVRTRSESAIDPGGTFAPAPSTVAGRAIVGDADTAEISDDIEAQRQGAEQGGRSCLRFEDGCLTRVGGVFYLIHVLLRSDLLSFDVGLRGWELLELLARCLLEREWPEVADDPVWEALAQLDFRTPGTHPGAEFTAQETYQAPDTWLRGLGDASRRVRFRSRGLEVWCAEGFLIRDAAASGASAPHARMTRQQRRALREEVRVCAAGLDLSPELRRFLHFLLPYMRWRLRRALGDAGLTEILRRKGTLYITRSHVDLVMRMQEISVPARIAGLDADPGWRPELGRVIKFHFIDE